MLEDEDTLIFSPNFAKVQMEIMRMVDCIANAAKMFPRIESKVYVDVEISNMYLKPAIPPDFIEDNRYALYRMLEDQRIGPELRLQDFDQYMSLMNGLDAEYIITFMKSKPPFEDFCELVNKYKSIEVSISRCIWGVVSMGLYEFHRGSLVETLEMLGRFMQTELLTRMVADQQAEMAQLEQEYLAISERALTVPMDTAELMAAKAYVLKTDNKTLPDMEDRLRLNLDHILWLTDYVLYTPLEIKQNSTTFQWYLEMPNVFKQSREIHAEKTIEYQELLRKRIEQFRRDLDLYWEQVQEYDNWGDFDQIEKYKKKAGVLDNRLVTAMEKIDRINEEETSYGWAMTQYPIRKQTHDKLTPYKKLFDSGYEFVEKRDKWLGAQVGSYEPEDIENDIGTIYRIVLKLEKSFGDRPQTRQLAESVNMHTGRVFFPI